LWAIVTHPIFEPEFRKGQDMIYIPYMMLFAMLYCVSNKDLRAEKFYELVEIEMTS
jgi:hypothetical protein